jgi:nicotinamidase-related amidase
MQRRSGIFSVATYINHLPVFSQPKEDRSGLTDGHERKFEGPSGCMDTPFSFLIINHKINNMSKIAKTGLEALLTPENSILVLIDHQPFQFTNLNSHEPTMVINAVTGLSKAAKIFNVPTILTTVIEERGGLIIKQIQEVFPEQKPINRTFINTWQDPAVTDIVAASGRKQLIIAGLWTEVCVAMPAIQAAGEGYDVFVVTDASGSVSKEAHDMAVRRMEAHGITPINWLAVASEWQRDWARTETAGQAAGLMMEHAGASGVAYAWELQLLATPVPAE